MAWIELHQAVWTHRKTLVLADELDLDVTYAAAHVIRLWTWALDNAPEGDLTGFSDRVIAFGAGWNGDAHLFVEALCTAGWLESHDQGRCIHDWNDYAGRLLEKRQANAERMRAARAQRAPSIKETRATNVQSTCDARAGATVPYRTVPNRTVPDLGTNARARARGQEPQEYRHGITANDLPPTSRATVRLTGLAKYSQ